MNRTWIMMLAVAFVTGAAFVSGSEGPEIVTQGEIVALSVEDGTVSVEETPDPEAELAPGAMQSGVKREFVINEGTQLTRNDEPIELSDISVGANVVVRYVMDAGRNVAIELDVRSPATE